MRSREKFVSDCWTIANAHNGSVKRKWNEVRYGLERSPNNRSLSYGVIGGVEQLDSVVSVCEGAVPRFWRALWRRLFAAPKSASIIRWEAGRSRKVRGAPGPTIFRFAFAQPHAGPGSVES
jgi:hypothetical protein